MAPGDKKKVADVKKGGVKKKTYRMPEKLPAGEILTDRNKTSWVLKKSIGVGGFGEIYDAIKSGEPGKSHYVIKIEPMENGPLFCERAVYLNIGKEEQIQEFVQLKKIKKLGMPTFYGFGSHTINNIEYRFIVIEKLGQNLWSLFEDCDREFPLPTILKISVQILYVLEYMHSQGYVHCDIKGGNLLLGERKGQENQVYLVDFGLACKFPNEYKPNPKKAHNGTLEYTSRDLHLGVPTRRGDLEILAYNMLLWVASELPWERLKTPQEVQKKKEELMKTPKKLISACFGAKPQSEGITNFILQVAKLTETEEPDYDSLRSALLQELKKLRSDVNKLEFPSEPSASNNVETPIKKPRGRPKKTLLKTVSCDDVSKLKTVQRKTSPKSPKKSPKKAAPTSTAKRSWKDFPTIVNGAGANLNEPPVKRGKF